MYRFLSLPKSSGCQRCRHGSMWLVQESLQISLSSFLGKYSFIPIAVSIRIVHKDNLSQHFHVLLRSRNGTPRGKMEHFQERSEDGTLHQGNRSASVCGIVSPQPSRALSMFVQKCCCQAGGWDRLLMSFLMSQICIKISQALKYDSVVVCFMESVNNNSHFGLASNAYYTKPKRISRKLSVTVAMGCKEKQRIGTPAYKIVYTRYQVEKLWKQWVW